MKNLKNLILLSVTLIFFISSCGSDDNPTPQSTDDDPALDPSFGSINLDGTPATVTDIKVGNINSFVLLSDGTVWSAGSMTEISLTFKKIHENVQSIYVLSRTIALITNDGTLYAFDDSSGQGSDTSITFVEIANDVKSASLGIGIISNITVAYIKNDNTLWLHLHIMESLGLATNQDEYQQVLTDIKSVKFSWIRDNVVAYLAVLKNDGTLWKTMGFELTNFTPSEIDTRYPINDGVFYQVLSNIAEIDNFGGIRTTTAVTTTGELFISRRFAVPLSYFGFVDDVNDESLERYSYKQYPNLDNIRATVNGSSNYFIIDGADNLLATGSNGGVHGDGTTGEKTSYQEVYQNVSKVTSNDGAQTFLLLNDGSIKTTGRNPHGMFGDGSELTIVKTHFDGENTSGDGVEGDEDILGTWFLPDGSSFTFNSTFNSDGTAQTGLLTIASQNNVCPDSEIPVDWSTSLGSITLKNGVYTFCSGNSTFQEQINATEAASVPYSISDDKSALNLNVQIWTK